MTSDGGAFIAGDRAGGDLPWTLTIRRLSSELRLDTSFGRRGRAPAYNGIIPTLYTVGVGVGPDGDVVALAGLGDSRFMLARFETTFGKADADADAIPDRIDRCPLGAARTRSGCRDVRRELAFVIWMYRPDHPPAHCHAQYGEHVAKIELGTLRVLNGSLPPRALRLVRQWAQLHPEELADNWTRAQALEPLVAIKPLP